MSSASAASSPASSIPTSQNHFAWRTTRRSSRLPEPYSTLRPAVITHLRSPTASLWKQSGPALGLESRTVTAITAGTGVTVVTEGATLRARMAAKKTNGHDPQTQAIVEVLERIEKRLERVENEAHATNERLDTTNARLGRVEKELTGLRREVHDIREDLHGL